MQQPPKKRHRVDISGDALATNNDINTDERRSAPKQRISRACDRCRSRRTKCDGSQPTCATCAAADVPCTYGSHTKKRGLPTGYVRLLESLWALVFESIPGAEDATLQLLRSATVIVGDAGVTLLSNTENHVGDHDQLLLNNQWAKSSVREAIDARVLKITAGVGGDDSEIASKCRVVWDGIAPPPDHHLEPWTAMSPHTHIIEPQPHADDSAVCKSSPASAQIRLPDDVWGQIGLYFNYCYCWLPVVPKHEIVRLLSRRQEVSSCTSSEMALLWSSLAVSSSLEPEPDQGLVMAYHSAAVRELDNDKQDTSTHHVAAILLLSLSKMELYHWKDAYLLVGQAARLVHYMHSSNSPPDPTLSRVYLCTFVLDTLLSSHLGVPTFLSADHIMSPLSVYEPEGPEEWDPGSWGSSGASRSQCPVRVMSIFGQLVRLMVVLNNAITPRKLPASAADALGDWLAQLPKHCSPDERSDTLTPPLANLHMVYQSVVKRIADFSSDESHMRYLPMLDPVGEYNRAFRTSASKAMLHICQRLSSPLKLGSGLQGAERSKPMTGTRDGLRTDIAWDPSDVFVAQSVMGLEDTAIGSSESTIHHTFPIQEHSHDRPVHAMSILDLGDSSERPQPVSNDAFCQNSHDAEAMQTILDDILAQQAGNGPFLSSFMQDLGFFDEDMLSQGGPV
jgi:hypothetical protein